MDLFWNDPIEQYQHLESVKMDDDDTKPQLPMVIIDQSAFTAEINMFILKTQLKHTVV
jgi:hypothetical protein